eukprot:COSAG06_NODE_52499_length_305_cov_0.757282_2_plen_43_part_01
MNPRVVVYVQWQLFWRLSLAAPSACSLVRDYSARAISLSHRES